jgi:signal transduction histidine kinase
LGIFQLLDGKIIPLVKDKNPLVSSTFSLFQEEDGSLLVGAETGLYSFKDGELTKFVKNGFSISRSVYFIIKSKQKNYWFGTIDGLTRWDGSSTIYNYSVDDGLSGYEMNRSAAVIDAENKLWIGTNTGLSSYSIGIERKAIPSPRLFLSTIETNAGNFYDLNKANYIPYDENTLQFTVRGISFRNENTIEYRIKLEGFDKDFYTLKQAQLYSIRYPNLPSGEYKLVVMAKNRLSVWSNPVFSESIIIEKPFYLKLWFMFFATVIFIILYLLVHKFLLTHREQARLETMVNKRTKELAESELKLKHTLDGLEEEVKQRTLELDNLNRTKDKIFSIISHDLRSPFMSILGFSEILEDELEEMDKKEIRSTVEKILVSSRNTVSLVDGLLEWSRLQIGGLVPEHRDVNVAKVIHVVLELFHPQITKKNIILSSQIEEDIHVFTDENIVKSVVSNLLSNAIKFTNPEGNILVSANKSGEEIILIVEDSGIGMNSEMVEKLFTLTGIKSRKGTANEKGTGLGMNITHDLLKKTGGDIKVESSPGEGTKFTVTFRNSD